MPAAMRDSLSTALEAHADSLAAIAQLKGLVARVRQGTRPSLPKRASQCDAGRVVDATVRIVRTEIEKAARLGVVLESSPNVAIDASVLGQVVLNLLLNAAQAVRPETRGENLISVRVGSSQGTGEITVSDNGPGIPGENLERIFDPFSRPKKRGLGLGSRSAASCSRRAAGRLRCRALQAREPCL
jgi:C4-dicarboxylate-specific signal transduction histidine kinase